MTNYSEKIISTFNNFNGKNLEILNSFYADEIIFQDPITLVHGLDQLKKYYSQAYKNVRSIRFEFTEIFNQDLTYGASWILHLNIKGLNKGQDYSIAGFTHFKFNSEGLVIKHQDYFDVGAMVYEKLPIQGRIILGIKKLLSHN